MTQSERQVLDKPTKVFGVQRFGHQLKVVNAATHGAALLMRIDDACEIPSRTLSLRRLREQIVVHAEENPTQLSGPVQKLRVGKLMTFVLECSEDIHTSQSQPLRDCARHHVIRVERQRHQRRPCRLSLSAAGEAWEDRR